MLAVPLWQATVFQVSSLTELTADAALCLLHSVCIVA